MGPRREPVRNGASSIPRAIAEDRRNRPDIVSMNRFHQTRAQTGDTVHVENHVRPKRRQHIARQLRESKMQAAFGSPIEDLARHAGNITGTIRPRRPHNYVELRPADCPKSGMSVNKTPQRKRRFTTAPKVSRKPPAGYRRQQTLGGP
jgi:hypothetical protein